MSKRCTTHFHACDCREQCFKDLELELASTKKILDEAKRELEITDTALSVAKKSNRVFIDQINGLFEQLDEAKEVIGFYADLKSWSEGSHNIYREIREDTENLMQSYQERPDILHPVGGKRARSFLAKHEKKEGVNG